MGVTVITSDGTEHELDVSANGTKVVRGPSAKQERAADKDKHRDRVRAAKRDYNHAGQKIAATIPNGQITELRLDGYRGKILWEADVLDPSGGKHEVKIDSASGHRQHD